MFQIRQLIIFLLFPLLLIACSDQQNDIIHMAEGDFRPIPSDQAQIKVVASTSIIADVVKNVGGDAIELDTIIGANQDSHSYEPTPQDLVLLEKADVIFINGWDLEEQLAHTIEENYGEKAYTISESIEPIYLDSTKDDGHDEQEDDHDEHDHGGVDPHVWLDIANVKVWTENAATVLSKLKPTNNDQFEQNKAAYINHLSVLAEDVSRQLEIIPSTDRKLVSNHASLAYFAREFDFTIVATVLPSASSNADASAKEIAEVINLMEEEHICAIVLGKGESAEMVDLISAEISTCDGNVKPIYLSIDSLGSGVDATYLGMYQSNVDTIIAGLTD